MRFNDICNIGLGLGIYDDDDGDHQKKKKKQSILRYDDLLPSLTLGPSKVYVEAMDYVQASSLSALSSFSNSISSEVKKEGDEEVEYNNNSDDEGSPRKKLRLNKAQFAVLEASFKEHTTLTPKQKQALAEKLNLRTRQVEVWFQNRRARTKLKQTEADCELLKKCCERLREENKRLYQELEELKSAKVSGGGGGGPLYAEATISICPCCQKICTDASNGSNKPSHHLIKTMSR